MHWPTALVVAALFTFAWVAVALHRRQSAAGFVSDVDRATYRTLRTAADAAGDLGEGLTADGAARAARPLQAILGTPAVALGDLSGVLAWEGAGEAHHRRTAPAHLRRAIETGRTVLIDADDLVCADPDCPIRSGLVTPLVVDERVVGTLAAYGPQTSPGLVRATEQVAGYVSSQLEVAEVGRERTRAMAAELRALRAQISPHFIYNSLTAIASFVRTDPDRARDLLLEFADFTRYSLRGGEFTTLADELRNVQRYLELEQARFGDRLQIELLIAPEVLPVALPYLAVQPLVENAVRHGLAAKEGTGVLSITARDAGSVAEIVVEDDGVGADPQVIQRALDGQGADSIGLGNVDARMREVYGDAYGLVVETAPGEGSKVILHVPKFAEHVRA